MKGTQNQINLENGYISEDFIMIFELIYLSYHCNLKWELWTEWARIISVRHFRNQSEHNYKAHTLSDISSFATGVPRKISNYCLVETFQFKHLRSVIY